jgi:hypothetical protein
LKLYAYPVYSAVQLLYRDGVQIKPQNPPLVGQLITDKHKQVPRLTLWPLEWTEFGCQDLHPLAVLWHPVLVVVRNDSMALRGFEAISKGPVRRWAAQKWLCDVMDSQRAREFLRPDPRFGELNP